MLTHPHDAQRRRPWPRLGSKGCLRPPRVWQSHEASCLVERPGLYDRKFESDSSGILVVMGQERQRTWLYPLVLRFRRVTATYLVVEGLRVPSPGSSRKTPGSAKAPRPGSRMKGIQVVLGRTDVEAASSRTVEGRYSAKALMEGPKLGRE